MQQQLDLRWQRDERCTGEQPESRGAVQEQEKRRRRRDAQAVFGPRLHDCMVGWRNKRTLNPNTVCVCVCVVCALRTHSSLEEGYNCVSWYSLKTFQFYFKAISSSPISHIEPGRLHFMAGVSASKPQHNTESNLGSKEKLYTYEYVFF